MVLLQTTVNMSNRNPMNDYMRRLQQVARSGGRGGFGGMPPGAPKGLGTAIGGLAVLAGGLFVVQNAIFNVDGGHRAIKYRRVSGVSKEIYAEGSSELSGFLGSLLTSTQELTSSCPGLRRRSTTMFERGRATCLP